MSDISQLNSRIYKEFYPTICNGMKQFYENNRTKSFAICLSGGYDSRFVLYMCKDLQIPVICYTFLLNGVESTDFKLAKEVCNAENCKLNIVSVPTDDASVIKTMEILATDFNCRKKTAFECTYPIYYLWQNIKEDVILTANASDNYFGVTRKYALHYKHLEDGLTKFKEDIFNDLETDQLPQKYILNRKYNKIMFDPFNTKELYKVFEGTTWNELNKPHLKGPLYFQFRDKYDAIKPYRSSYQCGDSGVREKCEEILLNSKYNTKNYKSVVGCYNEIVRLCINDNSSTKLF